MAGIQRLCHSFTRLCVGSVTHSNSAQLCGVAGVQNLIHRPRSLSSCPILLCNLTSSSRSFTYPTPPSTLSSPGFTPCRGFQVFSFQDGLSNYIKRYIAKGPPKNRKKKIKPTSGRPFLKAVVLKTIIKKPKKPNSANRKCVRVKLSTGQEAVAYIPGIGHNLQEHHTVLVRGGRVQDLPGVKLKCVRGKYDLAHVKKATS